MRHVFKLATLFGCLLFFAGTPNAQDRIDDHHLPNPDPQNCVFFGTRVTSEGEWLMAGTHTCSAVISGGRGIVAVYRRSEQGYNLHQVLDPNSGPGNYAMGDTSVDLSGSVLVASGFTWPNQLAPEGKAFVYELSGGAWSLTGGLIRSPIAPDAFATDVATGGETVFVGARSAGPTVAGIRTIRGAIYFYKKIAGVWTEVQVWTPPNNSSFDYALAGNRLAADEQVLAWGSELLNKLFIMEPDSNGVWDLVATIPNFTPRLDNLGWDIEVDGDTIVVGVEDELSQALGMVHVVSKVAGAWVMVDTIQIPDPNGHGSAFGYSVDLRGDRLAIGAPHAGDLGGGHRSPGAAYMYERDPAGDWNYQYKFIRPDGVMWDMLGTSVSIGDDYLLVGDRVGRVPPAWVNGSAFVFELPMGQETCPGATNSTGGAAKVEVLGTEEVAANWVKLRAVDLPPGVFGYFLGSQTQGWLPGVGGSQGNLCLGGVLYRFNRSGQWGAASVDGRREMRLNILDPLQGSSPPILAGQNWTFQFWYRDRNPMSTTNFSGATGVMFR